MVASITLTRIVLPKIMRQKYGNPAVEHTEPTGRNIIHGIFSPGKREMIDDRDLASITI